jgi:hypothetical protein
MYFTVFVSFGRALDSGLSGIDGIPLAQAVRPFPFFASKLAHE